MRYDGVCSSRDGEEVGLVSSQQLVLHHHCLTLLQIHSSARPFIQGLLATPPAAPEAVQLICKEVQQREQQPVASRVGMDRRLGLSARLLQTFFAPATAALVMLLLLLHSSCCPAVYLAHLSPLCTPDPQLCCNASYLALFLRREMSELNKKLFNQNIFKWIHLDSKGISFD